MLAAALCNAFLHLYHDPAAWLRRENGATYAVWNPGARLVMGTEGRGIHRVDSRGYLNPEKPLEKNYVLVVGSSFTQGKEVAAGKRFTDILNEELARSEDALAVYNVSQDGFYLPDILRCFPALRLEFPDAGALVIETGTTAFTEETLRDAMAPRSSGEPAEPPSWQGLLTDIKEALPILTLGKAQLTAVLGSENQDPDGIPACAETLDAALGVLRSEFPGSILILYHPAVEITGAGMALVEEDTVAAFREACERVGIVFLDTSEAFLRAYEENYTVPCGFFNTVPGTGHLNAQGHRLCAEVLLDALKGGGAG